ncbi:MAG TPA: ATP-binding protein [Chlamydiales bacterium]|nr:ATP-binding protein [Chlamydiales bacterium]
MRRSLRIRKDINLIIFCFLVLNLFLNVEFRIMLLILGAEFLIYFFLIFMKRGSPFRKTANLIRSYSKEEFEKIAAVLNAMNENLEKQIVRLKLARREVEEILESLGEGVIATDMQAKTTFANEWACKFLGVSRAELLSIPLNRIDGMQKDLALLCHELIQEVLKTSQLVKKSWHESKRGIYLEVVAATRFQRGVILVLQDKSSDFKVVEMGKDFIANASHELKTPITIIRGFAETLQDFPNLSPQMLQDVLEKIVRTSHRLENLIKSLLTLADIENYSQDKLQLTDLVWIAEHAKQFAMTVHLSAHISFQSELQSASILGDAHLLDLAIMNLIENGIKYSSVPTNIDIKIQKKESRVLLHVQDNGIGIPESDILHIFDRFYTVDKARSRKSGGAGLGLSIVKTIVEKHMGTISVASTPGAGSTFIVDLPLRMVYPK